MKKTQTEIEEELKALKAKMMCKLWALTTFIDGDDEDEEKARTIILKEPNRITRAAAEKVQKKDTYKGMEVFLQGMHVGGDDLKEILSNDQAFFIACETAIDIIEVKTGKLKRA